jgi:hypothetical protein
VDYRDPSTVDQKLGPWYWSFNPTIGRSLHGESSGRGLQFSPNGKFSYDVTKKVAAGLEYYGSVGPLPALTHSAISNSSFFPRLISISPRGGKLISAWASALPARPTTSSPNSSSATASTFRRVCAKRKQSYASM